MTNSGKQRPALFIAHSAIIAALYVVLTWISSLFGLSSGAIQFRLSEALVILPYFTAAAIPGLSVGCLIANIFFGTGPWDVLLGTAATVIGAFGTYLLRKHKWLAPLPPILANTVIIPLVLFAIPEIVSDLEALIRSLGLPAIHPILFMAATVFIGEFVMCGVFGMILLFALQKRPSILPDSNQASGELVTKRSPKTFRERFPLYVWICFAFLLIVDLLVFYGTRPFLRNAQFHSLTLPLDTKIPFIPEWVSLYFLSYISWIVTIIWILRESKQHAYRLCGVFTIIAILSAICFIAYPVTMQRPEVTGTGFFNDWMRLLYRVDSPNNLCPSFHVVISYLCWRGTMGCRKIPKWYQWFNLVLLILVCLCILFVKQHVLLDIVVAVVISELALQIGRLTRIERIAFAIERAVLKNK